jgi:hypothetical protein
VDAERVSTRAINTTREAVAAPCTHVDRAGWEPPNTQTGNRVSLSMVTSIDLQLSVALLAGTAAAMIVSPVRRSVPRWVEASIWLGLIVACWLAFTNLKDANVRFLTDSLAWGVDQIVKTSFGLMLAGVLAWMSEHRFPIAYAVVVLLGADILLLALKRTHRQAEDMQPRIMLGDWIEIPLQRTPARVEVPYAIDELNRRAERAAAMLGAAFLTWLVNLMIWTRDVLIPGARARQAQVVAAGHVRATAGLESLRERAFRLQAAARAQRVGQVFRRAAFGDTDHAVTDDQVINITALLRAQSIGWYGPISPVRPGVSSNTEEGQEDESDRLAS